MLSKKSAGDLEACSALRKQVLNASRVLWKSLLCSPRAESTEAFHLLSPARPGSIAVCGLVQYRLKGSEISPVNDCQDYCAGLPSHWSFQQKNALAKCLQELQSCWSSRDCEGDRAGARLPALR